MIYMGYHEYIGDYSVNQRNIISTSGDIMIHVGEQIVKARHLY